MSKKISISLLLLCLGLFSQAQNYQKMPQAVKTTVQGMDVEDHGKSHRRNGCRNGIFQIIVMRNHTDGREEITDAAQFHGKSNTESHCRYHQQCIHCPDNTDLNII